MRMRQFPVKCRFSGQVLFVLLLGIHHDFNFQKQQQFKDSGFKNFGGQYLVSALENVQRQSDTCGVQQLIRNDVRSVAPWTVAVFRGQMPTPSNPVSSMPFHERPRFYSSGQIIAKNLILIVHGGPAGKYVNRSPKFFIAAGINTTDWSRHDKFRQMSKVVFIEPFRSHNVSNVYYHYTLYHLETSLEFHTPYVRDACIPIFLTTRKTDWSSVEPYGWPGFQVGFAKVPIKTRRGGLNGEFEEEIHDLKAWKAVVGPKKVCTSVFRFYYKRKDLPFYCTTRVIQNYPSYTSILNSFSNLPEDNELCQGHGSAFIYTLGPYCYLSHMVTMIPGNKRGKCDLKSAYGQELFYPTILITLMEWLYFTTRCGPTKFACGEDLTCIPLSAVCNGVRDCRDGSDEHYTICDKPLSVMSSKSSDNSNFTGLSNVSSGGEGRFNEIVCEPLKFSSNGVTCSDLRRNVSVDCRKAGYNGAVIQLGCDNYYAPPRFGFPTVKTACVNNQWVDVRPFFCEPVCGLLKTPEGLPLHTNYSGFPWHAAIFQDTTQVCGANLVENSFLVTHADCLAEGLKYPERRTKFQVFIRPMTGNYWNNLDNPITEWYKIKNVWLTPKNITMGKFPGFAVVHLQGYVDTNGENKPMTGCSPLLSGKKAAVGQVGKMTALSKSKALNVISNVKVVPSEECGENLHSSQICVQLISTADLPEDEGPLTDLEFTGGLYFPKKTASGRVSYVLNAIPSQADGKSVIGKSDHFLFTHVTKKLSEWVVDTLESNS